jgi:hypothetical protein
MKLYRLFPWPEDNHAYIESTGFDYNEIVMRLILGEKLEAIDSSSLVVKRYTKKFPDLMGTGSSEFFVSEKLKLFFEEHIENDRLNFIEIKIKSKTYFLINLLGLRDAMDFEKSDFVSSPNPDVPSKIYDLTVDSSKVKTLDLFRLKQMPAPIFITEELKTLMEENNFTGIRYRQGSQLDKKR